MAFYFLRIDISKKLGSFLSLSRGLFLFCWLKFTGFRVIIQIMIKIIKEKIALQQLTELAKEWFGDIVKGAVDVKRRILALGGELHSDAAEVLFEDGSNPADVWGFNIYLNLSGDKRLEFIALINIKPSLGNRSMEIENQEIVSEIKKIISDLVDFQ